PPLPRNDPSAPARPTHRAQLPADPVYAARSMTTSSPKPRRMAGVLLHPTSLPGPHGMGDVGRAARRFIDWLAASGLSLWQVLPLNPTSNNSPYMCWSAF